MLRVNPVGWAVLLSVLALVSSSTMATPPEVGPSVRFDADGVSLHWDSVPGAERYNVYRGTAPDGSDLACLRFRVPETHAVDEEVPAELFTYVVAAWNAEGEGSLGSGSDGSPREPAVRCADDDGDDVRDDQDNCPETSNPDQQDHNENGRGDACDGLTYTFEEDVLGERPADTTQLGGFDDTFLVRDLGGDQGVSYGGDGGQTGVHDRFDRLAADLSQQDVDVYLDPNDTSGETLTLALWNDGTRAERAGGGVELRVDASGELAAHQRRGAELTPLGEATVGGGDRLRLRLRKREETTSELLVDTWDGVSWVEEAAVFEMTDDHRLEGRDVTLVSADGGRLGTLRLSASPYAPEPALTVRRGPEALDGWKLFQRGPDNDATIPLPVITRCPRDCRLEARLIESDTGSVLPGFGFADLTWSLPASPGGGHVSDLSIPEVPAGGNYDMELRLLAADDDALLGEAAVTELAVGDVFLAVGQSNMSGYSGTLDPAEEPVDDVHLFGNDYDWKRGREPMDDGTDQVDRVSEEAPFHSLMLPFAKRIADQIGVPVAIIPAPLGGTNLQNQWQRNDALPEDRGTLYGSSVYRVEVQGYDHPIRAVLWYQGEADVGRSTEAYLEDLRTLVDDYRADLEAPDLFFGNCQLATHLFAFDLEAWLSIQEAQRRYALEDPPSAVVALVDQPRSDSIHLNVAGYKEAGRRLANAVLEGSYALDAPLGPQLVSVAFESASRNRIILTYDKDVSGGAPSLYRVANGQAPIGINAVNASGNQVRLDLAEPAEPGATITYGYSRTPDVAWVLAVDGSGTALAFRQVPIDPP